MKRIKAVIVEDEENSYSLLRSLIEELYPEMQIINWSRTISDAKNHINCNDLDLLFLDVNLEDGSGFELLDALGEYRFQVIFTTGHSDFAHLAYQYDALYYILKPYSPSEVKKSILKFKKLNGSTSEPHENEFVIISTEDGKEKIKTREILYLEADRSYCHIYLVEGRRIIVGKSLSEIFNQLTSKTFIRTHKSFVVNKDHVIKYISENKGCLVLAGGNKIPIARRRKEEVLAIFSDI